MIDGTAEAMEPFRWLYAKRKPVERLEHGGPNALGELSTDELKGRLPLGSVVRSKN